MNSNVYYLKEYSKNFDLTTLSQKFIDEFEIGEYVIYDIDEMSFTEVKEFFDTHKIELTYCKSGGQEYRKYGPGTCKIVDIETEPKYTYVGGIRDDISTGNVIELNINGSSGDIELEKEMALIFKESFELWKLKHLSYGPENIAEFGMTGILIRSTDKNKRWKNLVWNKVQNPLENENLEDTLKDNANYNLMAISVNRNKWPGLKNE